ncbi:MAG: hypothetical protein NT154_36490 [Verrucomicrobia bacterium]|nr:hypothetical protein [Verrucomicrobiota bacterium]
MNTAQNLILPLLAASTLVVGCATPHATKWEYKVEDARNWVLRDSRTPVWQAIYQSHLNDLGKDGWVFIQRDETIFYFKRPIK